jgi:dienelactone hydrolase
MMMKLVRGGVGACLAAGLMVGLWMWPASPTQAQEGGVSLSELALVGPDDYTSRLAQVEATEDGQDIGASLARRLEDRPLFELAQRYEAADPTERRLLAEQLERLASPERWMQALSREEEARPRFAPGRLRGRVRAMGRGAAYVAYVPDGYNPEREWPVHISLHGGGGSAERNCDEYWDGEPAKRGMILICPETPKAHWWLPLGEATVLAALEEAKRLFRIDSDRISIDGASSGGFGVWHMATKYPWLFRAAMPRCAATPKDPLVFENLAALPVYMLHGERDGQIRVWHSEKSAEVLESLDYDVTFEKVPNVGHNFMADRNEALLQWLAPQDRQPQMEFTYHTVAWGDAPRRVHWLSVDWGDSYAAGVELKGRLESRQVGGRWRNEVHVDVDPGVKLRGFTVLLPRNMWQTVEPVKVYFNGRLVVESRVPPSAEAVLDSWVDHHDEGLLTDRGLRVDLDSARTPLVAR